MLDEQAEAAPRQTTAPLADVVEFLAAHAPFDAVERPALDRIASSIEVEFHLAGATIFAQGEQPLGHLRVVRSGSVELLHDDRVLDHLESGELFGQASMLSGLPAGFSARAAEDTLCYRIPAEEARILLARPEGLRYVARSLLQTPAEAMGLRPLATVGDPALTPVASLIGAEPVVCSPQDAIAEAARRMTEAGQSCVVVRLPDGELGILTDRDLRSRVLAAGVGGDAPVSAAMTAPAYTCRPDQLAEEVLLEMLDRDIHHYPVVSATGRLLGVLADTDLVAIETRSTFNLRKAIGRARSQEELVAAASELPATVIALHDARVDAANVMAIYTVVVDALTRRLLELAVAARSQVPAFAWLALGSLARREGTPGSDVDSAIVWFDAPGEESAPGAEETLALLREIGAEVVTGLEACGLRRDEQGVNASDPLVVRALSSWRRAVTGWLENPTADQALILVSVFVDSRPVWGIHMGTPIADTFASAPRNPLLLRLLARMALAYRPPTGFLRGIVVEHSGEHRGRLDIKHGGMLPIADLARWGGMAAGVTSASTRERLRAAADAGTIPAEDARTLEDAWDLMTELRLEHQIGCLRAGRTPDDHVDPAALSALTRSHLKESFRAIASIQKRIASELSLGAR